MPGLITDLCDHVGRALNILVVWVYSWAVIWLCVSIETLTIGGCPFKSTKKRLPLKSFQNLLKGICVSLFPLVVLKGI